MSAMIEERGGYSRIPYIDTAKGIGIILVCLGHSVGKLAEPLNRLILSFHMPLFFFLAGMLFSNAIRNDASCFLKKKCRTLLIPQITLGFIGLIANLMIDCIVTKEYPLRQIDLISPFLSWFLPTMFIMSVVLFILLKATKGDTAKMVITLFVILVLFLLTPPVDILFATQSLVACIFGILGYLLRPMVDYYNNFFPYKGFSFLTLPGVAILSMMNVPIGMYINQYGNKWLFIITACLGIYTSLDLACLGQESRVLQFWGENSLIIYITHPVILRVLCGIVAKLIGETLTAQYPYYLLCFIVLALLEYPVILLANTMFPFLFGKRESR